MSTDRTTTRRASRWRWGTPVLAVAIGVAYLVAGLLGGDVAFAVFGLVLMLSLAIGMLLLRRSSETVAGLLDRRDERINGFDVTATAFAGGVVLLVVIVAFVVDIARGNNGSPYAALGAIGGVSYVAAMIYLRARR